MAMGLVEEERLAALKAKPFVLSGCPEDTFEGRWFVDELRPVVCGQPHFVNHYGAYTTVIERLHAPLLCTTIHPVVV